MDRGHKMQDRGATSFVNSVANRPCCLCGKKPANGAQQILPVHNEYFGVPAGGSIYIPLCQRCLRNEFDPAKIERHLIANGINPEAQKH